MQSFISQLSKEKDPDRTPVQIEQARKMKAIFPTLEEVENPIFDDFVTMGTLFEEVPNDEPIMDAIDPEIFRQEGYEKGYDAGFSTALKNATQEIAMRDQMIDELNKQIEALEEKKSDEVRQTVKSLFRVKEEYIESIQKDIKKVILSVSEKIVSQKLSEDETLSRMLSEGLGILSDHTQVLLRVHPKIFQKVKNQEDTLRNEFPTLDVTILDDHSLKSNGFLVETEDSEINLLFDEKLNQLKELLGGL